LKTVLSVFVDSVIWIFGVMHWMMLSHDEPLKLMKSSQKRSMSKAQKMIMNKSV
jgi:hypothetical protein